MTIYGIVFYVCVIIGTIGLITITWIDSQLELSICNIAKTIFWLLPWSFVLSMFAMLTFGNAAMILLFSLVDTIFGTNIAEGAPKNFFK